VVGAFAKDPRILGWDVWNEPDNTNDGSYADPADKVQRVLVLLPRVFEWARFVHPRHAHQWRVERRLVVGGQAESDGTYSA
jgi:hypothetical protein